MGHFNRHDEPGILSNVFSFISREISEFIINAKSGQRQAHPSITTPSSLSPRSDSLQPAPVPRNIDAQDSQPGPSNSRIRMLEEEVRMLKEELSRRHCPPSPQTRVSIPSPPPPPLPPPPGVRIPLPLHLGESKAIFASARAALRPTEAAATGSTNDLARSASGKVRQPTVNVPSDKMAAFLNEMRTVRVSDQPEPSGLSRSMSSTTVGVDGRREEMARHGSSSLASTAVGSKAASTSQFHSAARIPKPKFTLTASKPSSSSSSSSTYPALSLNATRPAKRKADFLSDSEGGSPSKRRLGTRARAQSDTSSSSTSSRTHEFFSAFTHSNLSITANHSSLSNETDITTPSVCSDNELGGAADSKMVSTPPGARSAAAAVHSAHNEVAEIADVDMEDKNVDIEPAPITPSRPQGDMFKRRPPMSPLPVPTPMRARAPARAKGRMSVLTPKRTKRGATRKPKPKSIMLLDEDQEDEEPDELPLPPKLKWRRGSA
ncbi:hypothetical protein BD769DRAFT_549305 [Suillus cothurnatus]|nr:hypothetical protein BD769DRAFT_549305 [Suillus cothurnatus]